MELQLRKEEEGSRRTQSTRCTVIGDMYNATKLFYSTCKCITMLYESYSLMTDTHNRTVKALANTRAHARTHARTHTHTHSLEPVA